MPLAVRAVVIVEDDSGDTAPCTVRIPAGLSFNDYQEFVENFCSALLGVSRGKIVGAKVCVGADLTTSGVLKFTPLANADRFEKYRFIFQSVVNGFRKILRLPTAIDTLMLPNSDFVDFSEPAVQNFVDGMSTGILLDDGTTTVVPTTERGQDLSSNVTGYQAFRRK